MTYAMDKVTELYNKIVRPYGIPSKIVSDKDSQFTSSFWQSVQRVMGIELTFSTAIHSQTNGQSERMIQTLEDMLQTCVLDFKCSWV
jgi:transposase InsO family protein